MNELQVFNYDNHTIRTVQKDNETWWVLKDVCGVLGIGNSRDVTARLDEDEKGVDTTDTLRGKQELTVISESGLYNVILLSRKPEAKRFKRWVTHDVLPTIRKHGIYATDKVIDNILNDPDFGIRLLKELKSEREKVKQLETENATQRQLLAEAQPKATYYDLVLQTNDVISTSEIAKDYGKSAKWLNTLLHDLGIQYNCNGVWLLYQRYAENGYTRTKTHTYTHKDGKQHSKVHTYWTQKGRLFIYETLKREGLFPLVERAA